MTDTSNLQFNSDNPFSLNAAQVQKKLNVSRATFYRLIKSNVLHPLGLTKRNRLFNFDDVHDLSLNGDRKYVSQENGI